MTDWNALVSSLHTLQYGAAERLGERSLALPPNPPAAPAAISYALDEEIADRSGSGRQFRA
ncbi:hypothetical protein [Nocardia seriolae]|uniref:Uncharacterized protein n=1 Tax=Nocardia seriolae TaxID=37332 RepID=A0A0B8NEL0_9NOCA|nr:hypothetical protein [Nocardia seriolae]APA96391.1 hypothetical protein NS506_02325 [Nocardia seriolae]MTJ71683.1 hypothetical protein [Nocardia seriolae]MTJ86496.1 hypothetical protein [Nocardia seriolae]MTK39436.1 hypothetical protein [Nocardia seriolae]MTK47060.1 hypothetical protein [Nocardia seriolae]